MWVWILGMIKVFAFLSVLGYQMWIIHPFIIFEDRKLQSGKIKISPHPLCNLCCILYHSDFVVISVRLIHDRVCCYATTQAEIFQILLNFTTFTIQRNHLRSLGHRDPMLLLHTQSTRQLQLYYISSLKYTRKDPVKHKGKLRDGAVLVRLRLG